MLEPSYRQALARAWTLVWRHKILWVLGLLSIFVGELGLSNFLGQIWAKFVSPTDSWWPTGWGAIHITSPGMMFWFGWLLIIAGAFLIFVMVAAVCAQAALIYTALHWYRFHTVPALSESWHKGARHFWGILAVTIMEKILLSALIVIAVTLTPLLSNSLGGFYAAILILAVSAFLAFLIVLTAIFALGYIVHDSLPVVEAVAAGWTLLNKHLLVSLEVTGLLLLCNVLLAWAISAGAVIVIIPSFLLALAGGSSGWNALMSFSVGLYLLLLIIAIGFISAIFNAFTTSAWMYLFMKMHHEGLTSRLIYWSKRLTGRG